ncbi:hypothetical protein BGX34_011402 [Mortierella sp. NVP85]|nr:hypothetical protein BGX34_011402 [Mortierella sp. NVP85]
MTMAHRVQQQQSHGYPQSALILSNNAQNLRYRLQVYPLELMLKVLPQRYAIPFINRNTECNNKPKQPIQDRIISKNTCACWMNNVRPNRRPNRRPNNNNSFKLYSQKSSHGMAAGQGSSAYLGRRHQQQPLKEHRLQEARYCVQHAHSTCKHTEKHVQYRRSEPTFGKIHTRFKRELQEIRFQGWQDAQVLEIEDRVSEREFQIVFNGVDEGNPSHIQSQQSSASGPPASSTQAKDMQGFIRSKAARNVREEITTSGIRISGARVSFFNLRQRRSRFYQLCQEGSETLPAANQVDTQCILKVLATVLIFHKTLLSAAEDITKCLTGPSLDLTPEGMSTALQPH